MWATFPLGVDAILKYARDGLKAGSVYLRIASTPRGNVAHILTDSFRCSGKRERLTMATP
jgi:hypothetical protein